MKSLIITSSGGGAHLTVAERERDRLISETGIEKESIPVIDLMGVNRNIATNVEPWIPAYGIPYTGIDFFSGQANVDQWDLTQKMGGMDGVRKLERLIDYQYVAESIQSSTIINKLNQFFQEHPELEEIIDTQALNTADICYAVTNENKRRAEKTPPGTPIKVRKIISEFLTDKTVHYLDPISRVPESDAACLTVEIVNSPLRFEHESEAEFFARKKVDHIRFEIIKAPLRKEFLNPVYAETKTVYLQVAQDEKINGPLKEQKFIGDMLDGIAQPNGRHYTIQKKDGDKFFTISLGSQGSVTILRYIDAFIEQVLDAKLKKNQRVMFFIAAGKNDGSTNTMYAKVRNHMEKRISELEMAGIKWPDSAKVVPLAFQDDKSMASLFQNSDVLITRTGGMTSIEANETQHFNTNRKVYLHSEAIPELPVTFPKYHFDSCYDSLLKGTVRWEGGNAQYLMKNIDACLTSPETLMFNIDNKASIPGFEGSLLQMASTGKLNRDYINKIATCFQAGSDPNIVSFGGLPVLAYAQDMATLKECINYGGKLTEAVLNYLSPKTMSSLQIKELQDLEAQIQNETINYGAPVKVENLFIQACKKGKTDTVRGLMYRYPKLAFLKSLNNIVPRQNKKEVRWIIDQAKGATALQLALQDTSISTGVLKRLIFLNQKELNQEYSPGVTPLTLCENKKLRKLMVKLGAYPSFLNKNVTTTERVALGKAYQDSDVATNALKRFILDAYDRYKDKQDAFCSAVAKKLTTICGGPNHYFEKIAKSAFIELQSAKNEIEQMSIIGKIIDILKKYLFGSDLSSERARIQSRQLLLHPDAEAEPALNNKKKVIDTFMNALDEFVKINPEYNEKLFQAIQAWRSGGDLYIDNKISLQEYQRRSNQALAGSLAENPDNKNIVKAVGCMFKLLGNMNKGAGLKKTMFFNNSKALSTSQKEFKSALDALTGFERKNVPW